jgi:putative MFS transporter
MGTVPTFETGQIGPRLDRLPVSGFHFRVVGLIGAGLFLDAFDLYLGGGVLGAVLHSGWSTMALNSGFITATFLGMVIGAFFSGVLGDRYGRRFTFQFNLAVFGLASLAAVFAPTMGALIATRFVMGIGLGAEIVISYATVTEFVPARNRGRWLAVMNIISTCALPVSSLISYWVIPTLGWRYMFLLVGVLALIVCLLRKSMPESPRWLESKGRHAEADLIVRAAEDRAKGRLAPPAEWIPPGATPKADARMQDLFARNVIGRLLIGVMLNVVLNLGLFGFLSWLPSFFIREGMGIGSSLGFVTLLSLGGPLGVVVVFLLADRISPRAGIIAASLIAAAAGAIYPMAGHGVWFIVIGLILIGAIYATNTFGFCTHVPELFPTRLRLRGVGVCGTSGRLTTALVQYGVVVLFEWGGVAAVVGTLSAVYVLQAAVMAVFGLDTNRRSMEEVSAGGAAPGSLGGAMLDPHVESG